MYRNGSKYPGIKTDIIKLKTVAIVRLDWHTGNVALVFERDLKELQIKSNSLRESIGSIRFNKKRIKDVRLRKGMYVVVLRD